MPCATPDRVASFSHTVRSSRRGSGVPVQDSKTDLFAGTADPGVIVASCSLLVLAVRFSEDDERGARQEIEARLGGELTPTSALAVGDRLSAELS